MKTPFPPLNWLRAFDVAARHGNLTRAAEEIGVTQTAISQHIKNLEAHLGAKLFDRGTRGVALTEIGMAYLPTVRIAFEGLADGTIELFGEGAQRPLVIRCSPSFAHKCLLPRAGEFIRQYPDILLRVEHMTWQTRHDFTDVDLEIRFGSGNWEGCDIELLFHDTWAPYATPELVRRMGPLKGAEDLLRWPLISIVAVSEGWKHWFRSTLQHDVPFRPVLEVNSVTMAIESALSGYGVCLATPRYAEGHVTAGDLVRLHPHELPSADRGFVMTAKGAMHRPRIRTFINWLKSEFPPWTLETVTESAQK